MDFAQQLKSVVNIVDVIAERVPLKRVGSTARYMGLCPFHTEKTASFSVHSTLQIYKCFGCGAGGDVFRFLMEMEGLSFYEAVKALAERQGMPMPQRSEYADRDSRIRESILRMNEIAQSLYVRLLHSAQGAEARAYLASRGVSMETAEEFGLGLSERSGKVAQQLLREGFPAELLEQSGLAARRQEGGGWYDKFRGRLMFPIHSETGKIAGFAGRALAPGEEPKYLNSPETPVYKKSQILYNLHRAREAARRENRFILVEGYMDVIGLDAAGVKEAVASCGTALTAEQVKRMKRSAERVVVNFDPDPAGARGVEKSISVLLDESVRIRVLELGDDLDPDEYIRQYGVEAYRRLLDHAPNYYFWLADQARKRYDNSTAEGRTEALRFLLPAILRIPDKIERVGVAGDLAAYLGVEHGVVLDEFKKAALDRRQAAIARRPKAGRPAEALLLQIVLLHPDLREKVLAEMEREQLWEGLASKEIFEAISELWPRQPDFRYEDLEARLPENARTLLSGMVFADELLEPDSSEAASALADSCLAELHHAHRQQALGSLKRRFEEALKAGRNEEATRLFEELDRRKREIVGRRPRGRTGTDGGR